MTERLSREQKEWKYYPQGQFENFLKIFWIKNSCLRTSRKMEQTFFFKWSIVDLQYCVSDKQKIWFNFICVYTYFSDYIPLMVIIEFPVLYSSVQFSSFQSLSRVRLFATPWIAACQASLSITNPRSSLRLTSIESVMPSSHLILCRPLLLLPPFPPSIRDFSNESTLRMRWPKYWSFSFSIIPSKEIPRLISFGNL